MGSFMRSGNRKSSGSWKNRLQKKEEELAYKHINRINREMLQLYDNIIFIVVNNKGNFITALQANEKPADFLMKVMMRIAINEEYILDDNHIDIVAGKVYLELIQSGILKQEEVIK